MLRRAIKIIVVAGAVILVGIQFVRPERTNPTSDPSASFEAVARPARQTASVVQRACQDCHSNATAWPWYSNLAPASWLVVSDVKEGRARLNLSEWNRLSPEMSQIRLRKMCEEASAGEMPPLQYTLIHRGAKLGPQDVSDLCSVAKGGS